MTNPPSAPPASTWTERLHLMVRPSLTFLVAAGLGAAGTFWAALSLPSGGQRSEAAAARS